MKRAFVALAMVASSCQAPPDIADNSASNISAQRVGAAPIDPGVYSPYVRENGWQKTFAKWGDAGVRRIQKLREAAAETVAQNPKCDAVELSEISDQRSAPPDSPVVYVDCRNSERFYLSEADVGGQLSSEKEKGSRFSSAELISRCTSEVKSRLNLPSTFDRDFFSVSDRQGTSGNRVVEFTFEAKNALGLTLPASARCVMTTQGQFEVEINER
ncbi:hypothetical protein N6H05_14675 [Sphingobium sp. WTD-1]|uniref:hypothetical protein n=1 Tax=Sphingobium sp. WTD-1 TaxID=2979467 RepID=UPI0024DEA21D|nr:hypothetical protein [Sphingobium sp. WTD-1]WIA54308.1 hypothetical protein N6H05_14675 [Sphingobium sp. WTD-1]